jgi:hypothetical protein
MKTEIKFRAVVTINSNKREFVYNYCFLNHENNHFFGTDLTNERPDIGEVLFINQFTGLRDNKNNEIYEGDIIETGIFGKVTIERCEFTKQLIAKWHKKDITAGITHIKHGEIIGNIYKL